MLEIGFGSFGSNTLAQKCLIEQTNNNNNNSVTNQQVFCTYLTDLYKLSRDASFYSSVLNNTSEAGFKLCSGSFLDNTAQSIESSIGKSRDNNSRDTGLNANNVVESLQLNNPSAFSPIYSYLDQTHIKRSSVPTGGNLLTAVEADEFYSTISRSLERFDNFKKLFLALDAQFLPHNFDTSSNYNLECLEYILEESKRKYILATVGWLPNTENSFTAQFDDIKFADSLMCFKHMVEANNCLVLPVLPSLSPRSRSNIESLSLNCKLWSVPESIYENVNTLGTVSALSFMSLGQLDRFVRTRLLSSNLYEASMKFTDYNNTCFHDLLVYNETDLSFDKLTYNNILTNVNLSSECLDKLKSANDRCDFNSLFASVDTPSEVTFRGRSCLIKNECFDIRYYGYLNQILILSKKVATRNLSIVSHSERHNVHELEEKIYDVLKSINIPVFD